MPTTPDTWDMHASPLRTAQLTPVKSRKRGRFGEPLHLLPSSTLGTCLAKGDTVLLNIFFSTVLVCVAQKKKYGLWSLMLREGGFGRKSELKKDFSSSEVLRVTGGTP